MLEASKDIRLGDKEHFIRYDWQEIHLLWQFNAPIMEKKNSEMSYRHDLWTTNVLVFFSPWIGKIRLVLYQYYIKFTRNWITWFKKGAQPNHNSINMWLNSLILINKYYLDPPSLLPSEPWKVHNFKRGKQNQKYIMGEKEKVIVEKWTVNLRTGVQSGERVSCPCPKLY